MYQSQSPYFRSYGLLHYPELAGNYARIGIAPYGLLSSGGRFEPLSCKPAHGPLIKKRGSRRSKNSVPGRAPDTTGRLRHCGRPDGDALPSGMPTAFPGLFPAGRKRPHQWRRLSSGKYVWIKRWWTSPASRMCVPETRLSSSGESGEESISACDLAKQAGTITTKS